MSDAADTTENASLLDELGTGFAHLHLHSEYSLLDGGNRVDKLVERVKELGMSSVAVTDHGNLFGAMSFYNTARRAGVKPILGTEAYVAAGDRRDRTYTGVQDGGYHLVLLAENLEGWQHLMELASEAYLTGFYFKPRIDRELIEKLNGGLIAINGHLGSEIAAHLVEYEKSGAQEHWDRALEVCDWYGRVFQDEGTGPRFYVELQHHVPEQNAINKHLIKLAEETGLPLVCDNDAHFLRAEDHDAHDSLICISTGKFKADPGRMRYTPELYVKSPQQMRDLFHNTYGDVGREACDNTLRIAERCNVEIPIGNHAPVVYINRPDESLAYAGEADRTTWFKKFCARYDLEPVTELAGMTDEAEREKRTLELEADCDKALRELCEAGLVWRYGGAIADKSDDSQYCADIHERLERELKILADKHISAYFVMVWDFVNWARQRGIPANARGSGVGTMVGYLLGLSNACPVEYGLLFERFTDPDRTEYPDIDIDLCQDGRADVIDYVRKKYGHVAQIITFGTLKAKAAIRDIGRVYEHPLKDTDELAKLVPDELKMTLDKALDQSPEFREKYEGDPTVKRIVDTGRVIEGQARHSSVHAAGVIVATRPLYEVVPLYKPAGAADDEIVTQWDGPTCEDVGLLKMDFLGLRTLSVIERAKDLIRETLDTKEIWKAICTGRDLPDAETMAEVDPLDLDNLTYDDDRVYEMFRRADTTGVFQFESGGMRRLLAEMRPDRLEDLIAANALFRPGPMDLIPSYNARKHGEEDVPPVHEIVDQYTADTYGIMIYQEQVMQIVHALGGIPLRAAYSLIKAISKKKEKVINANRPTFVENAARKGLDKKKAEELFELILKFAGYGFNKSHSTGYAIIAYQTAFLKTYFPNQYMAAFLTYESQAQKVEDWIKYKDDCRKTRFVDGSVGVDVMPPDINLSDADFTVVHGPEEDRDALHGHVRFGLKAIKGAGGKAIEAIVSERKSGGAYKSLYDFCERVPPGTVNKATIEALVVCGSFDSVHCIGDRAAMVASIENAVAAGQTLAKDRAAGQGGLFGGGGFGDEPEALDDRPEPALAKAAPWDEHTMLAREKEVLGFYVSSHPLDRYARDVAEFGNSTSVDLASRKQDQRVLVGGMIKQVRPVTTRKGDRMAIVTFEDLAGSFDAVLFPRTYAEHAAHMTTDSIVFLEGDVDHTRGDPQLKVERVIPVDKAPAELATRVELVVDTTSLNGAADQTLLHLSGLVRSRGVSVGAAPVPMGLVIREGNRDIVMESRVQLTPTADLIADLKTVLGPESVRVRGGKPIVQGGRQPFKPRFAG